MVSPETAPRDGGQDLIKPVLQPGIQLPPSPAVPIPSIATPGTSSPDVQSQRSSFERPRSQSRDVLADEARSRSRDVRSPAPSGLEGSGDEARDIIIQAFAPRVAVYTSPDADELIRVKGLYGGLCALLRPFGESVQGKVIVRDSVGASKSWSDFGICFTEFDRARVYALHPRAVGSSTTSQSLSLEGDGTLSATTEEARVRAQMLDDVVQAQILSRARQPPQSDGEPSADHDNPSAPPHFCHFLRRLLAERNMAAHATFTHPVACVIAITSQNATPIDTLRDLYNDTRQDSENTPPWMGNDFLRYYVLIHDDDHDDMAKSTALFNQMKRHFGLHTHLLRLRGVECARDAPDAMAVPACLWLSPEEELTEQRQKGDLIEFDEFQQFVHESDAVALRTFVREMVTQSVVPFMESRIATWDDQVASRRRGISGRFMSLSKRWTGFGSGRNKNTEAPSSKSNYNAALGGYPADSNESQMHRLADYALMLRDWKLSAATYDMLRGDFGDDKAWAHHAAANELLAASLLLGTHTPRSMKVETIDQLIDTATYSYLTRCGDPYGAFRCLVMMVELFRSRGGTAPEEAAKWATRLLELTVVPPALQALMAERLALAFHAPTGAGLLGWGTRRRKAALWHLLAASAWLGTGHTVPARSQLSSARHFSADNAGDSRRLLPAAWTGTEAYVQALQTAVALPSRGDAAGGLDTSALLDGMDEERHAFDEDTATTPRRATRFSMSGVPPSPGVEFLQQLSAEAHQEADGFA